MEIPFKEVGYTPNNLRTLIDVLGLTQQQTADHLGVNLVTVQKWLADTDKTSHRDMPLSQWRALLDLVQTT